MVRRDDIGSDLANGFAGLTPISKRRHDPAALRRRAAICAPFPLSHTGEGRKGMTTSAKDTTRRCKKCARVLDKLGVIVLTE